MLFAYIRSAAYRRKSPLFTYNYTFEDDVIIVDELLLTEEDLERPETLESIEIGQPMSNTDKKVVKVEIKTFYQ